MKSFFIVFSVVSAIVMAAGTDYCKLNCEDYQTGEIIEHVGCHASHKFNSKTCPPNAKLIKMTPALQSILVDGHNEKRNMIAGGLVKKYSPACRMATMQWDDELAELATLNVLKCTFDHDKCYNTVAFQYTGQSIALTPQTLEGRIDNAQELRKPVENWFKEYKNCNQRLIDSLPEDYKGPAIGHFTAMVTDKNIRLGCAASVYDVNGFSYTYTVCNYATSNMAGYPIYKACSKPAEDCTTGTHPLYTNLCSVGEKYDVNKW